MKERPILFSGDMVRAILDGRKTQTRRVIKYTFHPVTREPAGAVHPAKISGWVAWYPSDAEGLAEFTRQQYNYGFECPYGTIGDRLWVRETWFQWFEETIYRATETEENITWLEKHKTPSKQWRPSIFMPRWASRITLEITGVRVERVQDIHPVDCVNEGASMPDIYLSLDTHIHRFQELWNSINAKRGYGWDTNPWVWVIEFKRIKEVTNG